MEFEISSPFLRLPARVLENFEITGKIRRRPNPLGAISVLRTRLDEEAVLMLQTLDRLTIGIGIGTLGRLRPHLLHPDLLRLELAVDLHLLLVKILVRSLLAQAISDPHSPLRTGDFEMILPGIGRVPARTARRLTRGGPHRLGPATTESHIEGISMKGLWTTDVMSVIGMTTT